MMAQTFPAAVNAYRDAVASRVFWEDHGRHGDGKLEAAKLAERKARAELMRYAQRLADGDA